jgi:anti-sigma regulatory factor (Ser/Thr protein kinase)
MPWVVEFVALEKEVAALRRGVRARLEAWGLPQLADEAQLCVSELVANVIGHVGGGTPTTLVLLMNGTFLRIEVHDPDTRALPTLVSADVESESGRGMGLVAAVSDRWGVHLFADHKVTWCELPTRPESWKEHDGGPWTTRAQAVIDLYRAGDPPVHPWLGRLRVAEAEESAITLIADLLHWLAAHGRDADDVLDRAQMRFDSRTSIVR